MDLGLVAGFLSDLCGREGFEVANGEPNNFLSDLCGREDDGLLEQPTIPFLSDLCGREELRKQALWD